MPRVFAGLTWIIVALALGCLPTTTVAPTSCWDGLHGEYRLLAADGSDPGAVAVEEAARIIHARISSVGLADFEVRTRSDGVIEIVLPPIIDPSEVRSLIEPTGNIEFVAVPDGESVDVGDPFSSGAEMLLGRDAITSVSPGSTQTGERAFDVNLTEGAGDILARHSAAHIGRQLAIVMDGTVLSAPVIQAPLGSQFQISALDPAVVNRLVTILRLPPLPGRLEVLSFNEVDPAPECATPN